MSRILLALVTLVPVWPFPAQPAVEQGPGTCSLTIRLIDAATGKALPGIVQARDKNGEIVPLNELLNRGQGVQERGPIHHWWVLPESRAVAVPATTLTIAALAGLETELAAKSIDLAGQKQAEIEIALARCGDARQSGYLPGNTHLHLRQLSQAQADRYLREVPRADGVNIVFVSYLERAAADLEYTSNKYAPAELQALSTNEARFGYGQEHRHNFGSYGEGYGHVLLLDIPRPIQPVSIGPGLTRQGFDWPPLRRGIDAARRQGGKAIWAHNRRGFEAAPNFILGRLDANNVCDGNRHGSYEDPYYRYLNIGLRVPLSTGTDWFAYDFSRAYVLADANSSPTQWLANLVAGRSYVTNGPLLHLQVDDGALGDVIELPAPGNVRVRASASGRVDFERLELVRNGRVVHAAESRPRKGHFVAGVDLRLDVAESCWLALRAPQLAAEDDGNPRNEFDAALFAHTSPIYVRVGQQDVFDRQVAARFVAELTAHAQKIEQLGKFENDAQRQETLSVYHEAVDALNDRIDRSLLSQ